MKGHFVVELDNNSGGRFIMEAAEHMSWMTWQDQKRVVELCRDITKPLREAASARYKAKTGDVL